MPALKQDFGMVAGDSRTLAFTIRSATGSAVDMTDATARWWLAPAYTTASASVPVKKAAALALGLDGFWVATVVLLPAETEALAAGPYVHELEVIDAASGVSTVAQGTCFLRDSLIPPPP